MPSGRSFNNLLYIAFVESYMPNFIDAKHICRCKPADKPLYNARIPSCRAIVDIVPTRPRYCKFFGDTTVFAVAAVAALLPATADTGTGASP